MESNRLLHTAIMEVVENQLRDHEPPETKQNYERLLAEGFSEDNAKRMIGCVVASEIFDILKHGEAYNPVRFTKALSELPKLPEDERAVD